MKPLFEPGAAIQFWTAEVASTETKVFAALTPTAVATAIPGEGGAFPLTANSLQGVEPLTVSILIVPPTFTLPRNRVRVAF
jgi:hypothetical protein